MFKKHENENIKSYMEKRRMIAAKEILNIDFTSTHP
jgi:hypothetical protein